MNTIEIPYLPISDFKETYVCNEFEETSVKKIEDLNNVNQDFLFPKETELASEVALILHGMGMEKYIELLQKESIALETFLQLNEFDLQELGISDPKDRETITKSLEIHQTKRKESAVAENPLEDLKIARNIFNQLLLIQNYCAYIDLQMKKHKLTDYRINWKESACEYLKAFTKCAVTQSRILSSSLFDEDHSNHLIGKILKMNNLTLAKHLQEKLKSNKKRKLHVLKVMVVIGFCSLIILTGKSLIKRW